MDFASISTSVCATCPGAVATHAKVTGYCRFHLQSGSSSHATCVSATRARRGHVAAGGGLRAAFQNSPPSPRRGSLLAGSSEPSRVCFSALRTSAADLHIRHSFKRSRLWAGCVFAGYIVLPSRTVLGLGFSMFVPLRSGGFGNFEKPFHFLFPALIQGKTRFLLLISSSSFDLMSYSLTGVCRL